MCCSGEELSTSHVRSASVSTTVSEQEFRSQYQADRKQSADMAATKRRIIRRKSSTTTYKRLSEKVGGKLWRCHVGQGAKLKGLWATTPCRWSQETSHQGVGNTSGVQYKNVCSIFGHFNTKHYVFSSPYDLSMVLSGWHIKHVQRTSEWKVFSFLLCQKTDL